MEKRRFIKALTTENYGGVLQEKGLFQLTSNFRCRIYLDLDVKCFSKTFFPVERHSSKCRCHTVQVQIVTFYYRKRSTFQNV